MSLGRGCNKKPSVCGTGCWARITESLDDGRSKRVAGVSRICSFGAIWGSSLRYGEAGEGLCEGAGLAEGANRGGGEAGF